MNVLKKTLPLMLATALILSLGFFAFTRDKDVTITILHTNDTHGNVSGFPYVKAMKDALSEEGRNVLLFDAGDTFYGRPIATLTEGSAIVNIINTVGYDAMVMGNDDTRAGSDHVKELADALDFEVLSANYTDYAGKRIFPDDYTIIEKAGKKIGVFGLTAEIHETEEEIQNGRTPDPVETAIPIVSALQEEGADYIIALTHLGVGSAYADSGSEYVANNVDGIDLIIDGHSHTELADGEIVNDTLIVQTGENFNNIGEVTINFAADGSKTATAQLIPIDTYTTEYAADEDVLAVIDKEEIPIEAYSSEVIGSTPYLLDASRPGIRNSETNLGDLVADAMKAKTETEFALFPGGGIRASIEAGDITRGDILAVLANGGGYIIYESTGDYIYTLMEYALSELPDQSAGPHGWRQVSGIIVTYDSSKEPMSRVESITLEDGTPLDREETCLWSSGTVLEVPDEEAVKVETGDGLEYFLMEYIASGEAVYTEGPAGRLTDIAD